jgi:hypothetical protein
MTNTPSPKSKNSFRRAFEFTAEFQADLKKIKADICAKTDTDAMRYAVKLAARLSTCREGEIEQALWLLEQIAGRVHEGGTVVIEKMTPPFRTELILPPLRAKTPPPPGEC